MSRYVEYHLCHLALTGTFAQFTRTFLQQGARESACLLAI